ncbi:hypothetical protein V6Z12_A03G164600 [Gossypium hirsutum]
MDGSPGRLSKRSPKERGLIMGESCFTNSFVHFDIHGY